MKHLRAQLKPALARHGFVGGATRLYREMNDVWELVDVQTGRRFPVGLGDAKTLSFTANLAVASKWILGQKRGFPQRPPERIARHYENRLGMFMTPAFDRWWSIVDGAPDDEQAAVVRDFSDAIVTFGLPGIARYASDASLVESWRTARYPLSLSEQLWLAALEGKSQTS